MWINKKKRSGFVKPEAVLGDCWDRYVIGLYIYNRRKPLEKSLVLFVAEFFGWLTFLMSPTNEHILNSFTVTRIEVYQKADILHIHGTHGSSTTWHLPA